MNNINTVTNYFLMFVLYFMGLFVYNLENKSIFFGVRLPMEYNKKENFSQLKKEYRRNFSLSYLCLILIYIIIGVKVSEVWSVVIGNFLILLLLALLCVNYYIMHKKVKLLKEYENWKIPNEKETMNDKNYIIGTIYYNKEDPSLWVRKRGDGRISLNYAKPLSKVFLTILILAFVFAPANTLSFPEIFQDRNVTITDASITIEGKWGTTVNKNNISKVVLENNIPMTLRRIKGNTINKMRMGKYKVLNYNESYFYIMDKTKPFIAIYTKDNNFIAINYEDINKTKNLYKLLKAIEL